MFGFPQRQPPDRDLSANGLFGKLRERSKEVGCGIGKGRQPVWSAGSQWAPGTQFLGGSSRKECNTCTSELPHLRREGAGVSTHPLLPAIG